MKQLQIRLVVATFTAVTLTATDAAELLIKWKDGPRNPSAVVAHGRTGAAVKRNFPNIGWQLVSLPESTSSSDAIAIYSSCSEVLAVETNDRIPIARPLPIPGRTSPHVSSVTGFSTPFPGTPTDPLFSDQWYLEKIGATNAWLTSTGSSNTVVAIFDCGVDYTHPDLAANIWRNPGEIGLDATRRDKAGNGLDDDSNGYIDDVHGIDAITLTGDPMDEGWIFAGTSEPYYHGTFIAGLIGAVTGNELGIAGVNHSVSIMGVKVVTGDELAIPSFFEAYNAGRLLAAFEYVLEMKKRGVNIRAINHSEGLIAYSLAVRDAIHKINQLGIINCAAAGNDRVDHDLFSTFSNVQNLPSIIYVAASDESDLLTGFSDYGKSTVHLAAPGISMRSLTVNAGYRTGLGTSFSAPLVAASAALLASVQPNLTADQIKAALLGSVDRPTALRGKVITGGRLNVGRAVSYLTNNNPPAIVLSATPAGQRTPLDHPISVAFSKPVNRASVEQGFTINPSISGRFEWSDDQRSFSFVHDAPFDRTRVYTVRLPGSTLDATGETLDGNYDQIRSATTADDFTWTFRFPPGNDNFADALSIANVSGSIKGNTQFSIVEPYEPHYDIEEYGLSSVWYRWTAPPDAGWLTFDLGSGTSFDSLLGIFTGADVAHLTPVATNDNYGSLQSSRASFLAAAGVSYAIAIGRNSLVPLTETSPFALTWYPTPPPGFTGSQFFPASGAPGARITLSGTNFTGAAAVLFNGVSATFTNAPTHNLDLRITAIVPPDATSGPITVLTPHGNITSTVVFQTLRPNLDIKRDSQNQLNLSWSSPTFSLESSADLHSWTQLSASGATNFTVNVVERHSFFRLRIVLP